MNEVEELIRSKIAAEASQLQQISSYLLELGGKRIRPALCFLTARAFGKHPPEPKLIQIAAGIELIHMATLLHDDIIDKSPRRRNSDSAYLKFGLGDTLLTGDFLLVRAFSLCAQLDETIVLATERACVELTEGEILERPLSLYQASIEESLTIARKKTAALFRLACFAAAHLAKANPEIVNACSEFGESLGIAFQILDDILDVTADETLLGKPRGTDIREGKPSVVNILWLQTGSSLAAELLLSPQEMGELSAEQVERGIIELTEDNGEPVKEARKLAKHYADCALQNLEILEQSQNQSSLPELRALCDFVLTRLL
jgi:octaprenyl-diphosphate synthase